MKKLFILTAIAAIMLASCTNEDTSVDKNSNYLKVQVTGVNTKTVKNTFALNDSIKVFITGNGYTTIATAYKYDGNAWAVKKAGTDIQLTGNDATVYAYYPASLTPSALSTSGTFAVSIPATDDIAATGTPDLLWATPVASKNNKTAGTSNLAALTFNHALAKISFIIVKDASYPSDASQGVLNSISLSSAGNKIVNTGTTNLATGAFTAGTPTIGSVVYTPATSTKINQTGSTAVTAYALVAPVNYTSGDLVLKMTIDGKAMTVTNFLQTTDWSVANKNYQYTITVKPTGLTVSSTSIIADWNTSATGSDVSGQFDNILTPESNCYMVTPGSKIYIPVSRAVAGNAALGYVATGGGTTAFSTGDAFTAGVLWSDATITDRTATVFGPYIKVTAGATEGNFVVYAKKGSNIVWSWHIWVSNYIPSATAKPTAPTVTSGTGTIPYYGSQYWMDRNLGATTSTGNLQTSLGLYYQWGRKDPFPAASGVSSSTGQTINLSQGITYPAGATSITGFNTNVCYISSTTSPLNLANQSSYSVQYPLMFLTGWAGSTASAAADGTTAAGGTYSWNTDTNTKSIFDPCPVGWRVPSNTSYATSPWNSFGTAANAYSGASWSAGLFGMSVTTPAAAATFYPGSGFLLSSSGDLSEVGISGLYWSCSVNGYAVASALYFTNISFHASDNTDIRPYGFSVRCVQE